MRTAPRSLAGRSWQSSTANPEGGPHVADHNDRIQAIRSHGDRIHPIRSHDRLPIRHDRGDDRRRHRDHRGLPRPPGESFSGEPGAYQPGLLAEELLRLDRRDEPAGADPHRARRLRRRRRDPAAAHRVRTAPRQGLFLAAPGGVLRDSGAGVHAAAAVPERRDLRDGDRADRRRSAVLRGLPGARRRRVHGAAGAVHGAGFDPARRRPHLPRREHRDPVVLRQDQQGLRRRWTTTSGCSPTPRGSGR